MARLKSREAELDLRQTNFERQRWWQKASFSDRCLGCGSRLQTSDPHAEGYIPPSLLAQARKQPCLLYTSPSPRD